MSDAVAIIPARGGSRRIPRKNVLDFGGKPMLAWSVLAALESGEFDSVVVSTDDHEIAEIALAYGAQVPFLRPAELSGDHTPLMPVFRHVLGALRERGEEPATAACVYATAPFLRAGDITAAMTRWRDHGGADFILAVCEFRSAVQRAMSATEDGRLRFMWPESRLTRSQDLPAACHDAGQFFIGNTAAFERHDSALDAETLPYFIPAVRCQDIDTPLDWEHALALWRLSESSSSR